MSRKSLVLLALIAIAVIAAFRLRGPDFDWPLFFQSLWNVHPGWLMASVIATLATYLVRAFRWQVLLNPLKSIGVWLLLGATVIGFSAIYILGRAGELVRPLWLNRREHIPLTASVATIVVERFFDSMMLIGLFAGSLLLVQVPAAAGATLTIMTKAAWVIVIGSSGAIIFLFFFRSNIDRIVGYIRFARVASVLKNFSEGLSFLQQARSLGAVVLHSAILWVLIALSFWFLLLGMNFELTLAASTFVMVGAAIGSIAQLPGIGGGFQAGYIFFMTTFFKIPAEQAIATSLIAWAFTFAPTVVVATVYVISQGLSLKDLRTATALD